MTPAAKYYLCIDQGGHASRALIFDHQGGLLAKGLEEVREYRPQPGWVEQNPEELVASIRSAVGQALRHADKATAIECAGLATQRSSIVCWDKQTGAALSPVISWQDRRAHTWLSRFSAQTEAIHQTTGLVLSPHYGASKLRWCLDHLPSVKAAEEQNRLVFGPLASFLLFRLLAESPLVADPANASRTLLWNLRSLTWDPELLALFGIPPSTLPDCVPSRFSFGTLSIEEKNIPLVLATGDQSAALFAFGRPQSTSAYVNMGTGAFVQRAMGHHPGYHPRLLTGVVLQEAAELTYVLEGTVNGAGSALAWIQQELGLPNIEQALQKWLERKVEPPLFLNGISGLGAPFWVPDFPSRFVEVHPSDSPSGRGEPWHKVIAVAESIVFLIQANLEEMRHLPMPLERLCLSGGLSWYDGLCQRLADVSGVPVYRPVEYEATARGLAYLLAGRPSAWPETEPGAWFKPRTNPVLLARYRRWRVAMEQAVSKEA